MLAVEGSRSVRLFVLAVLSLATAGIFIISMRANYLYGRSIGQSPETQEAMAWANVGADAWKAFGLIIVAALWRSRWRRAAAATFCAWAICLCFSLTSAIGIYVQERTTLTGSRQVQHASLADARAGLAVIEEQLKSRGQQPTPTEIEAEIATVLARPVIVGERVRGTVGSISLSCSRGDPRTVATCAEIASLQRSLASARESEALTARADVVRNRIRTLQDRGASLPADPVAQFWMWLSRGALTADAVAFGMPLFFALMIEFVSTFGPVGIAAYAEATRRVTAGHTRTQSVAISHDASRLDATRVGSVIDYFSEQTEPTDADHAISLSELHRGYRQWCADVGMEALGEHAFSREFDAVREMPGLKRRIRKFGTRYFGIRLNALAR